MTKREQNLKHRYGLKAVEYDRMLTDQGGRCAVCGGVNAGGRALYVDHDHQTGAVRGLLCNNCNTALGLVAEDEFRLIALADYILRARLDEEFAVGY